MSKSIIFKKLIIYFKKQKDLSRISGRFIRFLLLVVMCLFYPFILEASIKSCVFKNSPETESKNQCHTTSNTDNSSLKQLREFLFENFDDDNSDQSLRELRLDRLKQECISGRYGVCITVGWECENMLSPDIKCAFKYTKEACKNSSSGCEEFEELRRRYPGFKNQKWV